MGVCTHHMGPKPRPPKFLKSPTATAIFENVSYRESKIEQGHFWKSPIGRPATTLRRLVQGKVECQNRGLGGHLWPLSPSRISCANSDPKQKSVSRPVLDLGGSAHICSGHAARRGFWALESTIFCWQPLGGFWSLEGCFSVPEWLLCSSGDGTPSALTCL